MEVLRILLNASLLGAMAVIPCAEVRVEARAGWVARRLVVVSFRRKRMRRGEGRGGTVECG